MEDMEDWVISDLPICFWLDKDSGMLMRIYLESGELTGTLLDTGEEFGPVSLTMDFGNFDSVSSLELPKEALETEALDVSTLL